MSRNSKKTVKTKTPKKSLSAINWKTIEYVVLLLIWVAIAMTISQYIIGLPMMWILDGKFSQPFWTCIYYGLTYVLSLVLVIIVPPRVINKLKTHANAKSNKKSQSIPQFTNLPDFTTSREELGLKDLPTVIDVGLAPVSYVVYLVLSGIFTSIMSAFTWFNAEETQDVGFGYFITTGDRVVAMIALVFIAPIAEEIIMRGWLYGKLREKLKIPVAMLLTSLLFGFLHGQWNVSVGVFALSLVLCGLREITGTIWSGMLLHMLSNGIAFYLLYIAI